MDTKWNIKVLLLIMLPIQLAAKQWISLTRLYRVLNYVIQLDLRFVHFVYPHDLILYDQVCCQESQCRNDTIWVPTTISSKSSLTISLTVDSSCVGKQLYGVRYLWRETPCPFKQAAIYSGTDSNLPSPPYLKLFWIYINELKMM